MTKRLEHVRRPTVAELHAEIHQLRQKAWLFRRLCEIVREQYGVYPGHHPDACIRNRRGVKEPPSQAAVQAVMADLLAGADEAVERAELLEESKVPAVE